MGGDDGAAPGGATPVQHEQAVRFLTTLRAPDGAEHVKEVSPAQHEFLQSKGLSNADIERARVDAQRPENLHLAVRADVGGDERALFDRATEAFDAPLAPTGAPAPPAPAPTYPRSPLALYAASQPPARDANEILEEYARTMNQPRYDAIMAYFRFLHFCMVFGGGFTAVVVLLYRRYILPRISASNDARSALVKLQASLFGRLGDAVNAWRDGGIRRLLPQGYEPKWIDVPVVRSADGEEAEAGEAGEREKEGTERGEGKGGEGARRGDAEDTGWRERSTEQRDATKGNTEQGAAPAEGDGDGATASAPESMAAPDAAEGTPIGEPGAPVRRRVLAPIDVTSPLRSALSSLRQSLRTVARAQSGGQRSSSKTASVAEEASADDEGLLDLTAPSPAATPEAADADEGSIEPVGPSRSSAALRADIGSLRSELCARLLSEEDALHGMSNRFNAFVQPSSRATSGPAVEIMQIRAEIRSLKGLMLSRRNFPSYMRTSRVTPRFSGSSS
ncbi:hypothetical protein MSPP1_002334 [Malassezia sp. CBS 17886]|nr:hypothetical protein MSPP1_002334 [Malassezia sp. CBS 17886]